MVSLHLALAVVLGLVIEGKTTCPNPDQVAAAIRPLLREEISGADDRLVLRESRSALIVELFDGQGALLAKRELRPDVSCAAQAHRVAVIAAAWQAELSEEPLPPAPELKPSEPERRAARLWPDAPPAAARRNPLFLGSGLRLKYAPNGGLAGAIEIEAGATWGSWGVGGGIDLDAARALHEADGETQNFFRFSAELGPTLRLWTGPEIQLRVDAIGAVLFADRASFDSGASVGVRVIPGHPPVRLFFDASAIVWPRFFHDDPQSPLSWFEAYVDVGLLLGGT